MVQHSLEGGAAEPQLQLLRLDVLGGDALRVRLLHENLPTGNVTGEEAFIGKGRSRKPRPHKGRKQRRLTDREKEARMSNWLANEARVQTEAARLAARRRRVTFIAPVAAPRFINEYL